MGSPLPEVLDSPLSRVTTNIGVLESGIDFDDFSAVEYLAKAFEDALYSLQYDKALVVQSQMAGEINNTQHEIITLIEELERAIVVQREKYRHLKLNVIPEIQANLKQSTKSINELTKAMKKRYPVEYAKGRDKVLNRVTDEDMDSDLFQ